MKYICNRCLKKGVRTELSQNLAERFVSEDGENLCNKCSVGVIKAKDNIIFKHESEPRKNYK